MTIRWQSIATLAQNDNKVCKAPVRMTKRKNNAIIILAAVFKITWLRSGDYNGAYFAQYLTASGMRYAAYPARLLAVRPALYNRVLQYPKSTLTFGRIN